MAASKILAMVAAALMCAGADGASGPVDIDGLSQPGAACNALKIVLDGSGAGGSAVGLDLIGGSSTVRGLVIQNFARAGNGQTHHLWRLRVKHPELTLCAGTNYWISAGAYSTGSFVVNSYFANAAPKCDPCATPHTWRITPGQYRSIRALSTEWADVEPKRDPREILTDTIGNPGDDDATPACIADANLDGSVTVDDIFSFLAAWFSGCP